jgi:hypothetical protein
VPQRQRVEHGPRAEGGDEAVDPRDLDQQAVQEPGGTPSISTISHRHRPGQAVHRLQADRQDVPQHDAVAHGQVDPPRHHRDHRRQRQQRDDRLVDRIERRFSIVGKVLGSRIENSTISPTIRITSP